MMGAHSLPHCWVIVSLLLLVVVVQQQYAQAFSCGGGMRMGLGGVKGSSMVDRRATLRGLLSAGAASAAAATVVLGTPVWAEEAKEEVTDKVYIDFSIGAEEAGRVVIGLFGKQAKDSVRNFLTVAEGKMTKGGNNYDQSLVTMIDEGTGRIDLGRIPAGKDKYEVRKIDATGRVRRTQRCYGEELVSYDLPLLKHDKAGRVSIASGGGSFDFTISTAPNPALDKGNMIVFGQVMSGMDVLDKLLQVAVSKEDPLGSKQSFAAAGRGFDPRAKLASVNKPLIKVTMAKVGKL